MRSISVMNYNAPEARFHSVKHGSKLEHTRTVRQELRALIFIDSRNSAKTGQHKEQQDEALDENETKPDENVPTSPNFYLVEVIFIVW